MKKYISLLLIGVLMAAMLTVHAYDSAPTQNTSKPEIILSLCDSQPESSLIGQMEQEFGRYLERASEGRITLKYYPSAALGDEFSCVQQVQLGALDLYRCDAAHLYDWGVKGVKGLNQPGSVSSWEAASAAASSAAGLQWLQNISDGDNGLVGFGSLTDYDKGTFSVYPVVFSAATWNKLSASDQELIANCWEQASEWYAEQNR